MAYITKGKDKGKLVKLHQYCNDWFMIEVDGKTKIVSPKAIHLSYEEYYQHKEAVNKGQVGEMMIWFEYFYTSFNGLAGVTFVGRK